MKKPIFSFFFSIAFLSLMSQDHSMHTNMLNVENNHKTHETHLITNGPIGVMADHMHHKGTFMLSYRYMFMNMNGMMNGTEGVGDEILLANHMISPQSMTMGMHMMGAMYALNDEVTIMAMGNYLVNDMALKTRMGAEFETSSRNFGDLSLSILKKLLNKPKHTLHMIFGTSIPIGTLDARDQTPMSENALLAYPMQIGSGTWDPFLSFNYSGQSQLINWGAQGKYKYRISANRREYSLGNSLEATSWAAFKVSQQLNFSIRVNFINIGSIDGANPEMNPMMMPLFNTSNSGGEQISLNGGVNYFFNNGSFKGVRIGIESGYVVYQDVVGYQMKNEFQSTIGLQYVFGMSH